MIRGCRLAAPPPHGMVPKMRVGWGTGKPSPRPGIRLWSMEDGSLIEMHFHTSIRDSFVDCETCWSRLNRLQTYHVT